MRRLEHDYKRGRNLRARAAVSQEEYDRIEGDYRAAVANDVAGYLGVQPGLVLDEFKRAATDRRAPAPMQQARTSIPAIEGMLLNALISSAITRKQVLPQISDTMTAGFLTREIFDALRQMAASDAAVTFSALEGRLAEGARARAGTNVGIGVTGIAGPAGGTPAKPVGTVAIAVAVDGETRVRTFQFVGGREQVKFQASQAALNMLRLLLLP